jgi:hypothetical protein
VFYDLFYNRVYLLIESDFYYGNEIQAGLVVFPVSYDAEIWNAYIVQDATLDAIDWVDGDGITVSGISAPSTYKPLQNDLFTFSISEVGPMIISASGTFDFDIGSIEVIITGSRGLPIVVAPDRAGYAEVRFWSTDIHRAQDGTEARVARMEEPKRLVEYRYLPQTQEGVEFMQSLMMVGNKYTVLQPLWYSRTILDQATDGSDTIHCDTSYGEFKIGDHVLIRMNDLYYDIKTIQSVVSGITGSITLNNPPRAFPSGTAVLPCITATTEMVASAGGSYRKQIKFQVKVKEL